MIGEVDSNDFIPDLNFCKFWIWHDFLSVSDDVVGRVSRTLTPSDNEIISVMMNSSFPFFLS